MKAPHQNLGQTGESLALTHLKKQGLKVLARNVVLRTGEIDILAQDRRTIVIVEVKTKTSTQLGAPAEMVHFFKQQKLRTLAREVAQRYPGRPLRIDVVAVLFRENKPEIDYIQNAVEDL